MFQACVDAPAGASDVSVRVSYPSGGQSNAPAQEIARRGNLPLLIGDDFLAEIPRGDLEESWQSAAKLGDAESSRYCQQAAGKLARAFRSEMATVDLQDIVANAAVLFVLSLQRNGVICPSEISPCIVVHDGDYAAGKVLAA